MDCYFIKKHNYYVDILLVSRGIINTSNYDTTFYQMFSDARLHSNNVLVELLTGFKVDDCTITDIYTKFFIKLDADRF